MGRSILLCVIFSVLFAPSVFPSSVTTREPDPVPSTATSSSPASLKPENATKSDIESTTTVDEMGSTHPTESSSEVESADDDGTIPNFVDEEIYYKYNVTEVTPDDNDTQGGGVWGISNESINRLLCYSVRSFIAVVGIVLFAGLIMVMTNFVNRIRGFGP